MFYLNLFKFLLMVFTINCYALPKKKLLIVAIPTGFVHDSIPSLQKMISKMAKEDKSFDLEIFSLSKKEDRKPLIMFGLHLQKIASLQKKLPPEEFHNLYKEYFNFLKNPKLTTFDDKWKVVATKEEIEKENKLHKNWIKNVLPLKFKKITTKFLSKFNGVIFANTTGELPLPDPLGFLNWIKQGNAFIGIHAASDTFHALPEYIEMLGGEFLSHGVQTGVTLLNANPSHPANKNLPLNWKIDLEEIYLFKNYDKEKVTELLVLDTHPDTKSPGRFPVAWCKSFGTGRVFYTSLGHRIDLIDNDSKLKDRINSIESSDFFKNHLLNGIKWALNTEI